MIREIRLYTIIPGREHVELERFERYLPAIFARHGIRCFRCWTGHAGAGSPSFVYAMVYESLAERETQWAAFYADPEWIHVRAQTQGDEEVVERFDTYFLRDNPEASPGLGTAEETAIAGTIHDLCFAEVAIGQSSRTNQFLRDVYLPALERAGAEVLMVSDFISGPRLPKIALLFAWPDANARQAGWRTVQSDPALFKARAAERKALGRPTLGVMDVWTLDPFPLPPHQAAATS